MTKSSNAFYLDLDQALYSLRTHFDMCKGATNDEVLEWSKFFRDWSKKASHYCGSWSAENLKHAENFVRNLEKSKVGVMGYEVLERVMAEAYWNLNQEILKALKQHNGTKEPLLAR